MNRSVLMRLFSAILAVGLIFSQVGEALAYGTYNYECGNTGWTCWEHDDGNDVSFGPSFTPYYTQREVLWSPYGIAIYKEDGPAMKAGAWNCVSGGTNDVNTPYQVSVSNSDPAPWAYIKGNGTTPHYLLFCMTFRNNGGGGWDTFWGYLNWDGDF